MIEVQTAVNDARGTSVLLQYFLGLVKNKSHYLLTGIVGNLFLKILKDYLIRLRHLQFQSALEFRKKCKFGSSS